MLSKFEEENAPALHQWAEEIDANQLDSAYIDTFVQDEQDRMASIPSGIPFEIELGQENDLELCEILQATLAIMPEKYFKTSSWQTVNSYFAQRNAEVLDRVRFKMNKQKKEQEFSLIDTTDKLGVQKHLMYKLEEHL